MIKGITVTLTVKTPSGKDPLGVTTYTDAQEAVPDVLVAPTTAQEITDMLTLTGRRAIYTLYIPKGDAHEWEDTTVSFFGRTFHTIGPVTDLIEQNVPGRWNRRVQVEHIGN